jgi:4-hydroxybenzoate polyprenyltransferase
VRKFPSREPACSPSAGIRATSTPHYRAVTGSAGFFRRRHYQRHHPHGAGAVRRVKKQLREPSDPMKNYWKIARFDHWIKQLFILPGVVFCLLLTKRAPDWALLPDLLFGFLATSFAASANYVINEWLDAGFDRYHPTKKHRPIVAENLSGKIIVVEYLWLAAAGLLFAWLVSPLMLAAAGALLCMGVAYNVKPVRSKDLPYVDVLSESVNNAIRLLIGWLIVDATVLPPASIIFGYWMGGAFLMGIKRFAEFRMINDPQLAARYRRSFQFYTERSLLISSFFYAMLSVFFTGIFMIKYRIELLLLIPFLCGLFCFYLNLSYKKDSSAQRPEKLYREKGLILYLLFFITLTMVLLMVSIPGLKWFLESTLIKMP